MWQTLAKVFTNLGLNNEEDEKAREEELEAIRAKFHRRDQVKFLFSSQGYPGVIAETDGETAAPHVEHEQPRATHNDLKPAQHWNVKNFPVQPDHGTLSAAELLEQTANDLISKPGVAEQFPMMRKHPLDELIEKQSQTGNLIVPTDYLRKKTPTQNNINVSKTA